ncbi:MAG: phosphatase, partial [Ruminococcaceae bacterium]|nr:phosphatase [Oscillospiraceae bacterium]
MIQDLHSHTYYSYCGQDSPEAVIQNAIKNDIELV